VIYLDHNATTAVAPEVLEAMMPYLTTEWGNPSSSYKFGSKLNGVVEVAREQVADLIGAHAGEVIFTSCATESNNATIHAAVNATGKRHIVTSAVEHSSVLNYCKALEGSHAKTQGREEDFTIETQRAQRTQQGCHSERSEESQSYRVTYLPVDRDGLLKVADLENAITEETAVVSLMWANNETGGVVPGERNRGDLPGARGVVPLRRGAGRQKMQN
jgi:cysteine desulfurase